MGIQNFPAVLQPIIQQGFLEREFDKLWCSRLGYRACADREESRSGIGETIHQDTCRPKAVCHDSNFRCHEYELR